jgi:hypothetical protein
MPDYEKMFELNEEITIKKNLIEDSLIYTIDNFYKYPDKIVDSFLKLGPDFDKRPTFNLTYFKDKRNIIESNKICKVYEFLSNVCKQNVLGNDNEIIVNFSRFETNNSNDYINNYWDPHTDAGYTAIIYLNKNDFYSGTNLYKKSNVNEISLKENPKQHAHWINKKNFELVYSIPPQYNRMVLFDGFKYFHGMNICNDDYFKKEYRINQVFFFQNSNYPNSNK